MKNKTYDKLILTIINFTLFFLLVKTLSIIEINVDKTKKLNQLLSMKKCFIKINENKNKTLLLPPLPYALIKQIGNNIFEIRDFLLALAWQQKIPPAAFDIKKFKIEILNIHNRYRAHHGALKLSYDKQCEASAKHWAELLSMRRSCLIHDTIKKYGENLFFFASPHYFTDPISMAEATVYSFYMEKRFYKYKIFNRQGFHQYGHFTQMLWRASRNIGVGVAIGRYSSYLKDICMPKRGSGTFIFIVIKYDPPGNVQKPLDYFKNVKPFY